jgi:hypothetical protein
MSAEEINEALELVIFKKAFKNIFVNSPPAVSGIVTFSLLMFLGFIIYSFVPNAVTQLILFSVLSLSLSYLFYNFSSDLTGAKWVVSTSMLASFIFWNYIFYIKYQKEQDIQKAGKKSFICNPKGICKKDGIEGVFNGLNTYKYQDDTKYIPAKEFTRDVSNVYTYTFWLKINYNVWTSRKFYGKNKVILFKGNYSGKEDPGDMTVWVIPNINAIQFVVGSTDNNPVHISVDFPFNKWVHYSLVVNNNIAEVYKNATLEKSMVIPGNSLLTDTNLYVGTNTKIRKFPGQMLFLTYQNKGLLPEEINEMYEKQYSAISRLGETENDPKHKKEKETCEENKNI